MPDGATMGELLWTPPERLSHESGLRHYLDRLAAGHLVRGDAAPATYGYDEVWRWSVEQPGAFWESIWRHYGVTSATPYGTPLAEAAMPGARWFPGARLNYAEHVLRGASGTSADGVALIHATEAGEPREITWGELRGRVGALAAALTEWGVRPGDRVAALLPNVPEAVVALLACAAVGAVWSACGPDFGAPGVIDRFQQIEPVVLLTVDGYRYGGKWHDRRDVAAAVLAALPTVRHVITVNNGAGNGADNSVENGGGDSAGDGRVADRGETAGGGADSAGPGAAHSAGSAAARPAGSAAAPSAAHPAAPPAVHRFADVVAGGREPVFTPVPFDHPLWVLYSSGTTGIPKGIVQGHGGILLEHYKLTGLHMDVKPGDRFFWYTSTSWMMWNVVVAALQQGATAVLYDGSPTHPDVSGLWRLADRLRLTHLGTSAGYLMACQKADIRPGTSYDLSALRMIGSTGSPLPPTGFAWVYDAVKPDIWLNALSGGTDVCTAFVAGNPLLPVYSGEIQCRCLGAAVAAWTADGEPVVGEVGELVLTAPMPSMPVSFWHDPDGTRYRDAYFDMFPGVWRHGDWCTITGHGGVIIHGRSDSTLNKQGVRMGSADIYEVVEKLPEVREALVVGVEQPDGGYWMPLFVVLAAGAELDDALRGRVAAAIRAQLSPRHVPDEVIAVAALPHTRTGKRLEVPVKRLLQGTAPGTAVNLGSVDDPEALRYFADLAAARRADRAGKADQARARPAGETA